MLGFEASELACSTLVTAERVLRTNADGCRARSGLGSAVMAAVGALAGMVQIALFSWVQRRVPQAYMGRTMSVLMFTFLGLSPVAASAAGVLLNNVGLGPLFVSAGFSLSAVALLCLTRPTLRGITIQPAPAKA